jgi:hypothetical protein
LDSKPDGKKVPRPESFARALEKPLSAEQLLHSAWVATGTKKEGAAAVELERSFVSTFPDLMPDTYNPSLQQALFLSNSSMVEDLVKPAPGNTTEKLLALKSKETQVREAFLNVLGRVPDDAELKQCQSLLDSQSSEKGVSNLMWALLTSAEFQLNH